MTPLRRLFTKKQWTITQGIKTARLDMSLQGKISFRLAS